MSWRELHDLLDMPVSSDGDEHVLQPCYNIGPTADIHAAYPEGERYIVTMRRQPIVLVVCILLMASCIHAARLENGVLMVEGKPFFPLGSWCT